ncbi:aminotransferase class I/II-fold pyridoxal phosphate-dependent enzyme [Histidinibacterium lentulum]|uniref:Aminotransferase n=1 Tax=Histidinibacterium lentulum TaxID=2480588 RepID=A0A3N2R5W1_9RHOB|nr:aminotransferase class I/II-fold pyridoxal phosphate-dependent enzyme [Histidinibacterium lentulum]ROU02875.1 aminotransferase class I/II-fold pyridoxal phosphate-dependent enzyme [Histidinibacterium lentulum]
MQFPERFADLPPYAFPRLRALLDGHEPGGVPCLMSIGEPKHPMPRFVAEVVAQTIDGLSRYPANDGTPAHLEAATGWIVRRYGVTLSPDRIIALNGTREGLYNAAMALCPETKSGARPAVLMPNPFYQVYAVAALSVGAEPVLLPATAETGHLPDLDAIPAELLDRTAIFYLCSPSNPQGAVAEPDYWARLLDLAERHDFRVFADECYSEIYRSTRPPGILAVAEARGVDPECVLAFHSLSKRSNLPGLRAGFAAGGQRSIAAMRRLRAYSGAPLSETLQAVATAAWADEAHVHENRALYAAKYALADEVLGDVPGYQPPEAGFFLWLPVPDGEAATLKLWRETGVKVLPGAYLGRDAGAGNPGAGYIRVALVAPAEETARGLELIRTCLYDDPKE